MYERPELEIILFLEKDVLNLDSWDDDWNDENADGNGWV